MKRNQVYILSDAIRIGKTTALQIWAEKNQNIAGFLSPDINGKRQFQNIETGEMIPMETDNKDLVVGKFVFDSSSFKQVEKTILTSWKSAKDDYIILDEVGPLEVNKDLGFHQLLKFLEKNTNQDKPNLLFVVRDYCLEAFLKKYSFNNVHVFTLKQFKNNFSF